MASRLYNQFLLSFNPQVVFVEGSFGIGATGAVASSTAVIQQAWVPGTSAVVGRGNVKVTRGGTGQYQIQFADNYYRLLEANFVPISPTSAAGSVSDGSLVVGLPYQITFASSSTNWVTLGVPSNITPVKGLPFVASSGASAGPTGGAGNGTVSRLITSGVASIEVLPNPNLLLSGNSSVPGQGGYLQIQTLNTSNAVANPTSGTVIRFSVLMRNSSLVLNNELPSNY